MKKTLFTYLLLLLLALSLARRGENDLSEANEHLAARLSESPVAVEVFSLNGFEAVET